MDQVDYSQPSFYRFSEDSLKLAKFVTKFLKGKSIHHLIDVCAGCGVIGIETANALETELGHISFVEYQKEFIPHLNWNLTHMLEKEIPFTILNTPLSNAELEKADIIVANPPYFDKENSRLSPNMNKAITRHFLLDSKEDLFDFFERNLNQEGIAFFIAPIEWREDALKKGAKVEEKSQNIQIYSWSPSGLKR